jgi:hypothetical protein
MDVVAVHSPGVVGRIFEVDLFELLQWGGTGEDAAVLEEEKGTVFEAEAVTCVLLYEMWLRSPSLISFGY